MSRDIFTRIYWFYRSAAFLCEWHKAISEDALYPHYLRFCTLKQARVAAHSWTHSRFLTHWTLRDKLLHLMALAHGRFMSSMVLLQNSRAQESFNLIFEIKMHINQNQFNCSSNLNILNFVSSLITELILWSFFASGEWTKKCIYKDWTSKVYTYKCSHIMVPNLNDCMSIKLYKKIIQIEELSWDTSSQWKGFLI